MLVWHFDNYKVTKKLGDRSRRSTGSPACRRVASVYLIKQPLQVTVLNMCNKFKESNQKRYKYYQQLIDT